MQIHFNANFFFFKDTSDFFHATGIFLYTKMPDENFFSCIFFYVQCKSPNIQTFSKLIITENNTE